MPRITESGLSRTIALLLQCMDYLLGIFASVNLCLWVSHTLQSIVILLLFIISIINFGHTTPNLTFWRDTSRKQRRARPTWKRWKKFRRRRIAYHLVMLCHRHQGNRPRRMDGTRFPSPISTRHRRWRRRNLRSRHQLWKRRVLQHEFFLCPTSSESGRFKLDTGMPDDMLN